MFIWGSFDVLNVFPIEFSRDSHRVPNVFPKVFPNSITVLSHLICPKLSFHVYKLQRRGWGRGAGGEGSTFVHLIWGVPNVSPKKKDRPMKVAPLEKKNKKNLGAPSTN
jgi:hypothetical protein